MEVKISGQIPSITKPRNIPEKAFFVLFLRVSGLTRECIMQQQQQPEPTKKSSFSKKKIPIANATNGARPSLTANFSLGLFFPFSLSLSLFLSFYLQCRK